MSWEVKIAFMWKHFHNAFPRGSEQGEGDFGGGRSVEKTSITPDTQFAVMKKMNVYIFYVSLIAYVSALINL